MTSLQGLAGSVTGDEPRAERPLWCEWEPKLLQTPANLLHVSGTELTQRFHVWKPTPRNVPEHRNVGEPRCPSERRWRSKQVPLKRRQKRIVVGLHVLPRGCDAARELGLRRGFTDTGGARRNEGQESGCRARGSRRRRMEKAGRKRAHSLAAVTVWEASGLFFPLSFRISISQSLAINVCYVESGRTGQRGSFPGQEQPHSGQEDAAGGLAPRATRK